MTGVLIDTSVWARVPASVPVAAAVRSLVDASPADEILICPPIAAEVGFSARSPADHSTLMRALRVYRDCPTTPDTRLTLAIQNALWSTGLLRASGAMDTLIAAYAIANDVTVIHYDRDFEHIATVTPGFRHRWIVPRGTV